MEPISAYLTSYGGVTVFTVNTSTALTNYDIPINLTNASGVSGYLGYLNNIPENRVYTNGTTRPDWYDVLITDGNDTVLPFWIENNTQTSVSAQAWVNLSSISTSNNTIVRVYYGNSSITSPTWNGNQTFPLWDDFNTAAVDTAKWTTTGGTTYNGYAIIPPTTTDNIASVTTFAGGYAYKARNNASTWSTVGTPTNMFGFRINSGSGAVMTMSTVPNSGQFQLLTQSNGGSNTGSNYAIPSANNFDTYNIVRNGTASTLLWIDKTAAVINTANVPTNSESAIVREEGSSGLGYIYSDWVFVRPYVYPEPSTSGYATYANVAPVSSFTATPVTGVGGVITNFTDTSSNIPTSWNWSFGDGSYSTFQNPVHTFTAGNHKISLNATNAFGSNTSVQNTWVNVTTQTPTVSPFYVNGSAMWSSAQTNYPVMLTISNTTGISSGSTIYTNGQSQPDWSDLYFNTTSGANLSYWIETDTMNATSATVWVQIPSIAASSTTTQYNANFGYYTGGVSTENGMNTFKLFDDFNGASVNSSQWITSAGSPTVSSGILSLPNNAEVNSINTFTGNVSVRQYAKEFSAATNFNIYGFSNVAITNTAAGLYYNNQWIARNGGSDSSSVHTFTKDTWNITEIAWLPSNVSFYSDGKYSTSITTNVPTVAINATLMSSTGGVGAVDWVLVRPYVYPEPQISNNATSSIIASFTQNVSSGLAPLVVQFTDTSTGANAWNWSFGDGGTSQIENPSHVFGSVGPYTVTLTAGNGVTNSTATTTITTLLLEWNDTLYYGNYGLQYSTFQDGYYWVVGSSASGNVASIKKYAANDTNTVLASTTTQGNATWGESYTPLVHGGYVLVPGWQTSSTAGARNIYVYYESNLTYITTLTLPGLGDPYYDPIHDKILFNFCTYPSGSYPNWSFYYVAPDQVLNTSAYTFVNVSTNKYPSYAAGSTGIDSHLITWNGSVWYFMNTGGGSYPWFIDVYKSTDLTNWTEQWNATSNANSNYGFTQWAANNKYLGIGYADSGYSHIKVTSDGTTWSDYNTNIPTTQYENHPLLWFPANNENIGVYTSSTRNTNANDNLYLFNVTSQNLSFQFALPNGTTIQQGYTDQQHSMELDTSGNMYVSNLMMNSVYYSEIVKYQTSTILQGSKNVFTTSFSGTPISGIPPLTVQFTDSSVNASLATAFYWDFGDGNTSYLKNPSHTYASAGSYTVDHSVSSEDGISWSNQTNYITVTTAGSPVANFTYTPT